MKAFNIDGFESYLKPILNSLNIKIHKNSSFEGVVDIMVSSLQAENLRQSTLVGNFKISFTVYSVPSITKLLNCRSKAENYYHSSKSEF